MYRVVRNLNSKSGTFKAYITIVRLLENKSKTYRTRVETPPLHLRLERPEITSSQSLPQPLRFPDAPPPELKPFSHIPSKKRDFSEIIDLISEDDDSVSLTPVQRKKSRSSSNSTVSSLEARTNKKDAGIVKRASPKLGNIVPKDCIEVLDLAIALLLISSVYKKRSS